MLLPEKDGRQTAISVKQGDKEVILDQPYAAARTPSQGPRAYVATPQEVNTQFGPALAAQPARATSFTLYFVEGKDEFTEQSRQVVNTILTEIAQRPVPDVLVIGHTDTVGSDQANDLLGQQRADIVRAALIRLGRPGGRHSRAVPRQAQPGRADGQRRGGAAQSPGRNHRALSRRAQGRSTPRPRHRRPATAMPAR